MVYKGCVDGCDSDIGVAVHCGDIYLFDLSGYEDCHRDEKELEPGQKIDLEEWYVTMPIDSFKKTLKSIKKK